MRLLVQATAAAGGGDRGGSAARQEGALLGSGWDVLRVYRYQRQPGAPAPGLRAAATGAHADAGLLTVAPLSTVPGLLLLSPCGQRWLQVEEEEEKEQEVQQQEEGAERGLLLLCFLGEAGARLLAAVRAEGRGGREAGAGGGSATEPAAPVLRAPVHFVQERGGSTARFSAPFFLRSPGQALLAPGLSYEAFMQHLAQRPWARMQGRECSAAEWAADF